MKYQSKIIEYSQFYELTFPITKEPVGPKFWKRILCYSGADLIVATDQFVARVDSALFMHYYNMRELMERLITEGHHAYIVIRTGLLRDIPEKEAFAKAHKAQDNISITFKASEPFVPAVKYDFFNS